LGFLFEGLVILFEGLVVRHLRRRLSRQKPRGASRRLRLQMSNGVSLSDNDGPHVRGAALATAAHGRACSAAAPRRLERLASLRRLRMPSLRANGGLLLLPESSQDAASQDPTSLGRASTLRRSRSRRLGSSPLGRVLDLRLAVLADHERLAARQMTGARFFIACSRSRARGLCFRRSRERE
jgi:hypothetical protein